jgi:D-psicose/D-tagatose/L-ribulose 3-epimerase
MKIAISNLAWQIEEEQIIAEIMQSFLIRGVEIALTKIWQLPLLATDRELNAYQNFWQSYGIEIVALQSLLFGKTELTIFENEPQRNQTFQYLSRIIELGSKLGAKILVFGAPNNRIIGTLEAKKAEEIAISFFYNLGQVAAHYDMMFCIEPNPNIYGCDFITNSLEGLELVTKTNSRGFRLHLDAAGMTLSEEAIQLAIAQSFPQLCHFHISEPNLMPIGEGGVDHQTFGKTLTNLNYQGWTSIEMKAQNTNSNSLNVKRALEIAINYYGS